MTTAPAVPRPAGVLPWLALAGRLLLAGVLGYAALTKIGDPAATVRAVRAYQLLPEWAAVPFAHALPSVELAVAVLLLLGVAVRLTGIAAALLMGMFFVGVASAAARGLQIDCGCFGGGGPTDHPAYALELFRDGFLLLVAIGVALVGRSRLALDPGPVQPLVTAEHDATSRSAQRRLRTAQVRHAEAEQRRARRLRGHQLGATGLVALAAVIGIAAASTPVASASGALATPPGVTAAGGVLVGSPTAPHRVVLFEDPQCPVCAQFERTSGQVLAAAVAQGKVSVEHRLRSFLGPESVRAVAALGAAAGTPHFADLSAAMFAHQPAEHSGGYTVEDLLALGAGVGLTDQAWTEAVRAQTYAPWAKVVDDRASRDGNVGTPELRLDGKKLDPSVVFDPARLAAALGVR